MSQQYTISAVSEHTRDYGDKRVYYVLLDGARPKDGVQAFELHKKQSSKAPAKGDTLDVKTFQEGTFNDEPYVKIITEFKERKGGGGGGGYGPEDIARITRSHSQEMAIRFVAATGDLDKLDPAAEVDRAAYLAGVIRPLVDWFDQDVMAAAARVAKDGKGQAELFPNGAGGEVPADGEGLPVAGTAGTADSSIPF